MKLTRILALALAMVLVIGTLAGCGKETVESSLPYAINEMDVDVIDELPDWTGEKLDLKLWWGQGVNHVAIGKTKKNDKFQAEFARVTGITLNEKESFDNGGVSIDSKIARVVASNTWPHLATDIGGEILDQLIEQDLIYDLTDLIPKYMPNYMSYINSNDELRALWERGARRKEDGKIWGFNHLHNNAFMFSDPEFTPDKYPEMTSKFEDVGSIYVRDDILKAVRPEAHTVKELQDIYMANGEFTEAEIADYTIDSLDELRKLLEDIKALGVKENGREVWPIYTYDGMDNWSLFSQAAFFSGAGYNTANSYFIYYDAKEDKLKNPAKEEWYKDYIKFWNQLYRDGLASEEALIDTKAAFDQKKNNGEYAILYGLNAPPTQDALKAGGKDYAYRKVFVTIPTNYERFGHARSIGITANITTIRFFKNMLTESQLEQILRAIDFCYTDAGMKFAQWGPEKAGLYEEKEDGSFMFVDKEFETAVAYDGAQDVLYDYGYSSFPPIAVLVGNDTSRLNKFHEQFVYQPLKDANRAPENYQTKYKYSYVKELDELPTLDFQWQIYSFASDVEGIKSLWAARQGVEDAFTHCLAAKTDEEFDKAWEELIAFEERNGYTDEVLEEANKVLVEKNGGDISGLIKLG